MYYSCKYFLLSKKKILAINKSNHFISKLYILKKYIYSNFNYHTQSKLINDLFNEITFFYKEFLIIINTKIKSVC